MNPKLAPTTQKKINDYWILWFNTSNSYSVIDLSFKAHLDLYLASKTDPEFYEQLNRSSNYKPIDYNTLKDTIETYLKECNTIKPSIELELISRDTTKQNICKTYSINNRTIKISFDIEVVLKTVHPAIAYLEADSNTSADVTFNIYLKDSFLYFYKNETLITKVPKEDYHLIQGKFITYLLCAMHNKEENDWIGTFHGSSISDGESAIMFVGLSGKGKSTLTALLAAHGLELVADDVSPLLAENLELYNNPAAVSIKAGAFNILKPLIKDFDTIETVTFNASKGQIKYIPFTKRTHLHYPCKAIVLANYQSNSKTDLKPVSVKEILEILIPDSWINHNANYAKQFLEWLGALHFYELTYSNTTEALQTVNAMFESFKIE